MHLQIYYYQYSHNFFSILLLENTLDKQVKKFQLSLYHHYNEKQNSSLYSPPEMKSFNINIDKSLQLNQSLAYQTVSGILIGNQHYDQITTGVPRLFGVREGASYLNFLGNISIGSKLPVSISKENQCPLSAILLFNKTWI